MKGDKRNKIIYQPEDWWTAFASKARNRKMSLSEWMGMRCLAGLTKQERDKLSQRLRRGRPRKG